MTSAPSTIGFISQTKLGELSRQRDRLRAEYAELLDAADAASGIEQLRILREGLAKIDMASPHRPSRLHRDLPNLDALLASRSGSDDLLQFWTDRLRAVIEQGRRRAETVYVFGKLLGEWDETAETDQQRQADAIRRELLEDVCTTSAAAPMRLLTSILEAFAESRDTIREAVSEAITTAEAYEYDGWMRLADNAHVAGTVRREAARFRRDPVLEGQLNDALAVATRNRSDWNWPETGIPARAMWTRNKWRLYPVLSLVEHAIVDACSKRWTNAIGEQFSSQAHIIVRQARLNKLRDLNSPEVILQNEIRMLNRALQQFDFGWYERIDPWTGRDVIEGERVGGVMLRRATEQADLRSRSAEAYYEQAAIPMVRLVHAEVQTLSAAFPNEPIHVAKLDISNYFAEVPHDVLLAMLSGIGVPTEGISFVQKFLTVPWLIEGEARTARRGVMMEQPLSHWLCETLMRLLERHVLSKARVRIVRQIDDICLMGPDADEVRNAWNAVHEFLADVGLSINEAKCGYTVLHGEPSRELPDNPAFWGMLQLNADGTWRVHEPSFEAFLSSTRTQIETRHSVFSKVQVYNDHLKHLTAAVGLAMDLGDAHRESANAACLRFGRELFEGGSIVEMLRKRISPPEADSIVDLPESWFAWPVTAGGLGLRLVEVIVGQYQLAFESRQKDRRPVPEHRPEDWQWNDSDWTAFYDDQQDTLEPASCRDSKRMQQLVESFIARGKTLSGGAQEGLSEYWRWVLSIHGPVILESFGTFEFLLTDLVPLQLIQEKLLQRGLSGSDAESTG